MKTALKDTDFNVICKENIIVLLDLVLQQMYKVDRTNNIYLVCIINTF